MNNVEEMIYNNITTIIKENLKTLIYNHDSCLYRFTNYCNQMYNTGKKETVVKVDEDLLKLFTEEALYALLNSNFLYEHKDIE